MSDHERPWWSSGSDPDAGVEPGPADEDREWASHDHGDGLGGGDVCQVCPICTALRMVEEVRPELLVHLTEAARHLTMAAKTVIDAQATGYGGRGLEHIPLDDDPS